MASTERREAAGLIVVGASVGGLLTAITAADHGYRVVLLERAKELGGSAGQDSETIAAAGTRFQRVADVTDSTDRLLADLQGAAPGRAAPELVRAIVEQSAALVEWLANRCGVGVTLQSKTAAGGHGVPRLHAVGEQGGAGLVAALVRAATHHTHIKVRATTEVERLLVGETGEVTGVGVHGDRRSPTTVTGPVVLACGGFAAADELVAQHSPEVASLPFLGNAPPKGDALRLAIGAGAATRDLDRCDVTPFLAQPSFMTIPRALVEHGAILVNQRGQRFTDETAAALPLAQAIRTQPGRVAYLVFDERIAQAVAMLDPFFGRVILARTSRRGASVGMLSKQLELAEAGLAATLETYGAIHEPYYGVRITGARGHTLGGITVDPAGRALSDGGTPIPGLYAVGGAAASIACGERDLAGLVPLTALGLGRLVAQGLDPIVDEG